MCNKSLVYITCETYTLCGISSCFRLLSPTHRQVIHALLTRPPLTKPPKELCPFDLNVLCTPPAFILSQDQTLENFISYTGLPAYDLLSSYSFLASFTLLSIYNSLTRFALAFLLCTYLLLFNFQWPLPPLSRQLDYYTTSLFLCQYLFLNFFAFFSRFFDSDLELQLLTCPLGQLSYFTTSLFICQYLFFNFYPFFFAFVICYNSYLPFYVYFWA